MLLSDLPLTAESVRAIVDKMNEQYAEQERVVVKNPRDRFTAYHAGTAWVTPPKGEARHINIYRDNRYFVKSELFDNDTLPLAVTMLTRSGKRVAVINQKAYALSQHDTTYGIVVGLIAHEVAHWLLGHLEPRKPDPAELIPGINLANGKEWGGAKELEADLCAVRMVGFAPVLAFHACMASGAYGLMRQILHNNRIHRLLEEIQKPEAQHAFNTKLCIQMLPENEITKSKENPTEEAVPFLPDSD